MSVPAGFRSAAVLGAGTMGAGIAQVAAQAGFPTLLYDIKQEFIDAGDFLQNARCIQRTE